MNTRTKWVVAGATSVLGLGTVFGAVSAANALDLDRSDDVVPVNGITVGDTATTKYPGSAVAPETTPAQPVTPAAPVAPSHDSAPSPVSPASPVSPDSPVSAVSADSDD